MIQHDNPMVESVGREIANRLADMEPFFKAGVKLTLIARRPERPDGGGDMVITTDSLSSVIEALRLRAGLADAPAASAGAPAEGAAREVQS